MDRRVRWGRVSIVGPAGTEIGGTWLDGPGDPDLGAVDAVARLALLAGRFGCTLALTDASPSLRSLVELAGLPVEMKRQAEVGEEPLGAHDRQEVRQPGDLPL